MGYDRGDSFLFDFEPNGIPFGSENRKENCHHDYIPFNVKGIGNIVFSVYTTTAVLVLREGNRNQVVLTIFRLIWNQTAYDCVDNFWDGLEDWGY